MTTIFRRFALIGAVLSCAVLASCVKDDESDEWITVQGWAKFTVEPAMQTAKNHSEMTAIEKSFLDLLNGQDFNTNTFTLKGYRKTVTKTIDEYIDKARGGFDNRGLSGYYEFTVELDSAQSGIAYSRTVNLGAPDKDDAPVKYTGYMRDISIGTRELASQDYTLTPVIRSSFYTTDLMCGIGGQYQVLGTTPTMDKDEAITDLILLQTYQPSFKCGSDSIVYYPVSETPIGMYKDLYLYYTRDKSMEPLNYAVRTELQTFTVPGAGKWRESIKGWEVVVNFYNVRGHYWTSMEYPVAEMNDGTVCRYLLVSRNSEVFL